MFFITRLYAVKIEFKREGEKENNIGFMEIILNFKEYSLLESSLRGDVYLSQRLSRNQQLSKNDLINELLEEIRSLEYDEGDNIPLENRMYHRGRELLRTITQKLYQNEADKYIAYLAAKKLVNLHDIEPDIMLTVKIV